MGDSRAVSIRPAIQRARSLACRRNSRDLAIRLTPSILRRNMPLRSRSVEHVRLNVAGHHRAHPKAAANFALQHRVPYETCRFDSRWSPLTKSRRSDRPVALPSSTGNAWAASAWPQWSQNFARSLCRGETVGANRIEDPARAAWKVDAPAETACAAGRLYTPRRLRTTSSWHHGRIVPRWTR